MMIFIKITFYIQRPSVTVTEHVVSLLSFRNSSRSLSRSIFGSNMAGDEHKGVNELKQTGGAEGNVKSWLPSHANNR